MPLPLGETILYSQNSIGGPIGGKQAPNISKEGTLTYDLAVRWLFRRSLPYFAANLPQNRGQNICLSLHYFHFCFSPLHDCTVTLLIALKSKMC